MNRVAVIRGGPSEEYDVSLKTGAEVLRALSARNYQPRDITITKGGEWLTEGRVQKPEQALSAIDKVFIALHGTYGEDGGIQRVISRFQLPYTGSTAIPSATAFNKELTKQYLQEHGVKMPRHVRFSREDLDLFEVKLDETREHLGEELVVKPVANGSSVGVSLASNKEQLETMVLRALKHHPRIMIEERIHGKEATVGVLERFRDEACYALPAIEIVPARSRSFFDYTAKYDGSTDEICPGRFSYEEKGMLAEAALLVHDRLGLTQISRSDFMVKDGEVYFLEVNTLPGLTKESLYPKAAASVGLTYEDLIDHLVVTATP